MPDITMCSNFACPQSDNCWRYGCPPSKYWQSYQVFEPEQDDEDGFVCKWFIEYPEIDFATDSDVAHKLKHTQP